jgi:hypothetical protein
VGRARQEEWAGSLIGLAASVAVVMARMGKEIFRIEQCHIYSFGVRFDGERPPVARQDSLAVPGLTSPRVPPSRRKPAAPPVSSPFHSLPSQLAAVRGPACRFVWSAWCLVRTTGDRSVTGVGGRAVFSGLLLPYRKCSGLRQSPRALTRSRRAVTESTIKAPARGRQSWIVASMIRRHAVWVFVQFARSPLAYPECHPPRGVGAGARSRARAKGPRVPRCPLTRIAGRKDPGGSGLLGASGARESP